MGGVIRLGKAAKIYYGGTEVTKLFRGGEEIWAKPIRSVYNNPGIATNENVLIVGSSDMACITYSCWNMGGNHNWLSVFRDDYNGDMFGSVSGNLLPGYDAAISLARVTLTQVLTNAENDVYPEEKNPLVSMGEYDALIMDAVDGLSWPFGFYPTDGDLLAVPQPYYWISDGAQAALVKEQLSQYRLVRLARAAGMERIYLSTPWPRLLNATDSSTDAAWRLRFDSVDVGSNYQQDRLNFQMEAEGLGGHVNLIPFHAVIARIYDDIEANIAPSYLTEIRMIFANTDQQGDGTDPTLEKHVYMLNHIGTYAIQCLLDRVVHNHDPRGKPNTDGNWTVPLEVATYLQNIAVEIGDSYSRTGRSRQNVGYVMHPIRDRDPATIVGNELLLFHNNGRVTNNVTVDFTKTGSIRHFFAVFGFDPDQVPSDDFLSVFNTWGTTGTRRTSLRATTGSSRESVTFRYENENTGTSSGGFLWSDRFFLPGTNTKQFAVEGYMGTNAYYDQYGHNMVFGITDLSMPISSIVDYGPPRCYLSGQRTATTFPVVNRLNVPSPGAWVDYFVASERILTDAERYDLWRHMSRTTQTDGWDALTPDLITP